MSNPINLSNLHPGRRRWSSAAAVMLLSAAVTFPPYVYKDDSSLEVKPSRLSRQEVDRLLSWCVSAGMLGEDSWPPAVKFYEFLKIMDTQEPGSARQQAPEEEEEDEEEENMDDDSPSEEGTESSSSPAPDATTNTHSELWQVFHIKWLFNFSNASVVFRLLNVM